MASELTASDETTDRQPLLRALTARYGHALRHRNYRLFFAGQSISLIGTWLTRFATQWMVYRLTKSAVMLSLMAFFGQAPAAVLAPVVGVLVDRWDRRRTVIATQVAAMLHASALAFFALTGRMTVWHLLALGFIQAIINAFETVARQSFVGSMVEDRADLPNAVALNSMMVNVARMIGPVFAAVLVTHFGEGGCFTVDALSYIAVIASLFAMTGIPRVTTARGGQVFSDMKEGVRYVTELPIVSAVLVLFAATSVLAGSYGTLLPLIAGETLHGGAGTLGQLMGAAGAGALASTIVLTRVTGTRRGHGAPAGQPDTHDLSLRLLLTCSLALGTGLLLMEFPHSTAQALPILFVIGGSIIMQAVLTNTVVQTTVAPAMVGRVMSLYVLVFFGGAPLGALLSGALAKHIGPVHTLAVAGLGCLISASFFARTLPRLRGQPAPAPG